MAPSAHEPRLNGAQLQLASQLGLTVPLTLVTNDFEAAQKFAADRGPVIYKTFRGLPRDEDGHVGEIWTQRLDPETFDDALAVTAHLSRQRCPRPVTYASRSPSGHETAGEVVHLVDVVTGSATTPTPTESRWEAREGGPVRLWERVEAVLSAYDDAGQPGRRRAPCRSTTAGSTLRHPQIRPAAARALTEAQTPGARAGRVTTPTA
jgi:hypothetical protein